VQSAVDIDGHERSLQEFAGKVTVIVNVASQCGYTDANYKGKTLIRYANKMSSFRSGSCSPG
jgi:glutathione peroxidase-family protein